MASGSPSILWRTLLSALARTYFGGGGNGVIGVGAGGGVVAGTPGADWSVAGTPVATGAFSAGGRSAAAGAGEVFLWQPATSSVRQISKARTERDFISEQLRCLQCWI